MNLFFFYDPYNEFLTVFKKLAKASGSIAMLFFWKKDAVACGSYWDMKFSS